jgi:hypothetical protein
MGVVAVTIECTSRRNEAMNKNKNNNNKKKELIESSHS